MSLLILLLSQLLFFSFWIALKHPQKLFELSSSFPAQSYYVKHDVTHRERVVVEARHLVAPVVVVLGVLIDGSVVVLVHGVDVVAGVGALHGVTRRGERIFTKLAQGCYCGMKRL